MSLTDLDRIDKVLDVMITFKGDIDKDIKARDNRIDTLEKKLEDVISTNASLSAQIKAVDCKIDVEQNKTDLRKLEKKLEEYMDNSKSSKSSKAEAKANLNQIDGMDETPEKKIQDLENKLKVSADEDKINKMTIKNLKVLGKQFRETCATKDKELLEKSILVDSLKSELEILMTEKERLSKEYEELSKKGKDKDDKIKSIISSMKANLLEVQKENRLLKASTEDESNANILTLREGLNKAKEEVTKTNLENKKIKGDLESQLSTLKDENIALKTQLNDIQDEKDKQLKDKDDKSEGENKKRKLSAFISSPSYNLDTDLSSSLDGYSSNEPLSPL